MKSRFFILLLLFPAFIFAQTDSLNFTDKQGKKQGKWQKSDKAGNIIYKGQFVNDKEVGDFTYYFPTGTVKSVLSYVNNGITAHSKSYSEEGNLISEGIYKNRKKDSIWTYYRASGEKLSIETYKDGKKEGTEITYANDGKPEESVEWKNNQRNGKWFRQIMKGGFLIGNYVNDELQGSYEVFSDSEQLKIKGQYEKSTKNGKWSFFDSQNRLTKTEEWKNNVLVKTEVIFHTQKGDVSIRPEQVAYMYAKGRNLYVKTFENKEIISQDAILEIIDIIGADGFEMINWEMKLYARQSAIIKTEIDPTTDKPQVFLNPALPFNVYLNRK